MASDGSAIAPPVGHNMATLVRPEGKKSTDSLADYIRYFDRVVKANEWTDKKAALAFGGLLEVGSTVLDTLEDDKRESWLEIKKSLGTQSECREARVQEFFQLSYESSERVEDFAAKCRNVVSAMYPKMAALYKEQVARDRFVHGLDNHLRTAVLNHPCAKMQDALEAAIMAQAVRTSLKLGGGNSSTGAHKNKSLGRGASAAKEQRGSGGVNSKSACWSCG